MKSAQKPARAGKESSASELISARIDELGDWRTDVLRRVRRLIRQADPAVAEEWKWNVPVWSHDGIVCTGEAYKQAVKLTFPRGASLSDPAMLFNASLGGNARRAIDIGEGAQIDAAAFKALIRAAVALNRSAKRERAPGRRMQRTPPPSSADDYLATLAGWQQRAVAALRCAVLDGAALDERIKWGHLVYFSNGPVLLIRAEPARLLFGFWRGQRLREIEPRLKPGGKYELATLVLEPDTPLDRDTVRRLVGEAVALNARYGDPTRASPAPRPRAAR